MYLRAWVLPTSSRLCVALEANPVRLRHRPSRSAGVEAVLVGGFRWVKSAALPGLQVFSCQVWEDNCLGVRLPQVRGYRGLSRAECGR